ncbi:cellulose binding domain-containing protein [Ruminiclostridium papyrosolvens]|uniref:CBM3 domain-containing protein n=1 Tax=Ruminiclostridium papyrosolvens C7 TaxID=1330534 RepID=U4QZZ9_9FIRM|nr:cellulose binding domain-containing protein [Ruminiclostridium papyrosolvens]EPR10041.1 hypothetical protein L323_15175 [Ruminiclostridium papyrosolvens C7]
MQKRSKIISATLAFLLLFQLFTFVINPPANAASGALRVEMYMENTAPTTNTISPNFKIANYGVNSLSLSSVNIRYYFTKDSGSTQNFNCDVSGVTGSFVDMTAPTANADNYLEISFPAGMSLAPNTSLELKTNISKADGSNYNQQNDYSFSLANTGYTEWSKATAYINNIKIWGSEPVFDPTHGFLVIVSSKIYGTCQSELNTYLSDLANEGWSPTLIKVNNVPDSNYAGDESFHVCENPNALKQVIRGYYEQGYQGFVIIGSAPSIPSASWEANPGSNENVPTDLFYSDMSNWSDSDGDGLYEASYNSQTSAPDMIYGRISAGAISDSDQQASQKTSEYLSKIHAFRFTENMTFDAKAFSFVDDDFVEYEPKMVSGLANLEKDIYSISNKSSTTKDNFMKLLKGGYRLGYETIHASQEGWSIPTHPNGSEDSAIFDYPSIDDINSITVKVNYLHLNSCSACDFTTSNLGATFLFNKDSNTGESNVCNITGMTISSNFFADPQYFEDLKTNCIGTAFNNMVSRFQDMNTNLRPEFILLGDPTLKYNFTKPQNKCPLVSNDLSDVNAYPNKPFKINFQTTDPENDPVFLDVAGLPDGASYNSNTKTIDWVPQASQAGNSYTVILTAYNKDSSGITINKYAQEFTIYVSRMSLYSQDIPNPGFESLNTDGTPSGWTQNVWYGRTYLDQNVVNSGSYSACVTGNDINTGGYYELDTNIEPDTHYLISGYIKTSNVTATYGRGACLEIQVPSTYGGMNCFFSNSIAGTQDWTPVYMHWYSGSDTSLKLHLSLNSSGTAWFDDIKLEKDYNLGFEFSANNKASGWSFYSSNSDPDTNSISMSDSSTKHSGLRSVSILSNQASNYAFLHKNIPVETNTDYRVSAWVKTQNVISGAVGANLAVISGTDLAVSGSVLDTNNGWTQIYVDFNSGSNTNAKIYCRLGDAINLAKGTAWFDDITIEKK